MDDRIRVLLVDRDEDDSMETRALLTRAGEAVFDVHWVSTIEAAREAIHSDKHDVCLFEFGLGDAQGIGLIAEATESWCQAPVIVLTGLRDEALDHLALEAGAIDYLVKGEVRPSALASRIRFAVRRQREINVLRARELRYATAISGSDVGLWDWDMIAGSVHYTRRWLSILGVGERSTASSPTEWFDRIHTEDAYAVSQAMSAHFDGTTSQFKSEHRLRHADGDYRWVLVEGRAVKDAQGRVTRFAGAMWDITERKRWELSLQDKAIRDELTGLYNRRYLIDRISVEMASARRHSYPLTLCICDIDHFKAVNDNHGHNTGDDVLSTFGQLLADSVRVEDIPARLGGDEFCVIMPHTDGQAAVHAIERLRKRVQEVVFAGVDGYSVNITATFGLVEMNKGHDAVRELINSADQALYEAKRHGRNRTAIAAAS